MDKTQSPWMAISTCDATDFMEVDLWLEIPATPRSMGFSDSFRVVDAFRRNGKWFHLHNGQEKELYPIYITHWMPKAQPPLNDAEEVVQSVGSGGGQSDKCHGVPANPREGWGAA